MNDMDDMDKLRAENACLREELNQVRAQLFAASEKSEQTDFIVRDKVKKVWDLKIELRKVNAVVSPLQVKVVAIEDILRNRGKHKTVWGWLPWSKIAKIWELISNY
jgi:chromosome segregation ATPase